MSEREKLGEAKRATLKTIGLKDCLLHSPHYHCAASAVPVDAVVVQQSKGAGMQTHPHPHSPPLPPPSHSHHRYTAGYGARRMHFCQLRCWDGHLMYTD